MRVSVPASSANLGPGFDALGMALDVPFVLSDERDDQLLAVEATHPAAVAFAAAGGEGPLWWRSPIPPGRGLGFSGAARVAGALLGCVRSGLSEAEARVRGLEIASELEHHPDNAAASMLGGITVAAGGSALRVPTSLDVRVVVWWPATETSTNKARAALPATVAFEDAVFNIGRTALLVAALSCGDLGALAAATEDRLHQDLRIALSPESGAVLELLRSAGVIAAWLSGSGPTVASLVIPDQAERVAALLPSAGTARVLDIDQRGARLG